MFYSFLPSFLPSFLRLFFPSLLQDAREDRRGAQLRSIAAEQDQQDLPQRPGDGAENEVAADVRRAELRPVSQSVQRQVNCFFIHRLSLYLSIYLSIDLSTIYGHICAVPLID